MARKHLNLYFLEMENQYKEMLPIVEEYRKLAQEGKVDEASYEGMLDQVNKLRENYERIAYIIMLLNKPARKDAKEDKITKTWYDALQGASKEAIIDENRDVLANLKEEIRKAKEKHE